MGQSGKNAFAILNASSKFRGVFLDNFLAKVSLFILIFLEISRMVMPFAPISERKFLNATPF